MIYFVFRAKGRIFLPLSSGTHGLLLSRISVRLRAGDNSGSSVCIKCGDDRGIIHNKVYNI